VEQIWKHFNDSKRHYLPDQQGLYCHKHRNNRTSTTGTRNSPIVELLHSVKLSSPPQPPNAQARPCLHPPDDSTPFNLTESIADRIKARQRLQLAEPEESIANGVKRRQRTNETANTATETIYEFSYVAIDPSTKTLELACPVLDPDTGKLLEYHQLLRDPKFRNYGSARQ
jgi:hypothetical protein